MDWVNAILDNRITGWSVAGLLSGYVIFMVLTDRLVSKKRMIQAVDAEKRVTAIYESRAIVLESVSEDIVKIGENMDKVLKALPNGLSDVR